MNQNIPSFEAYPPEMAKDETDINLRYYMTRLPLEKVEAYDPAWSDEKVMEWDGNFKTDGSLMMACCEREVEVEEYRQVLEQYREFLRRYGRGG